jgi:hypothetical protein
MVARDHHHADARVAALPDGLANSGTERIGERDEPAEAQVLLVIVAAAAQAREVALGNPQHSHPLLGEVRVGGLRPGPGGVRRL